MAMKELRLLWLKTRLEKDRQRLDKARNRLPELWRHLWCEPWYQLPELCRSLWRELRSLLRAYSYYLRTSYELRKVKPCQR